VAVREFSNLDGMVGDRLISQCGILECLDIIYCEGGDASYAVRWKQIKQ
jgi:hypothetical protein